MSWIASRFNFLAKVAIRFLSSHAPASASNAVTEEFGELRSVFCLFPSVTLESLSYLGITLTVSLTAHRQVHTYLSTLTHEMSLQAIPYLFVATLSYADHVLVNEFQSAFCLNEFFELLFRLLTLRASFRCLISFMYITTYCANPFLFHTIAIIKKVNN